MGSYNSYFTQINLHFNRRIKTSNDGGSLSSNTGLLVFKEFEDKIGFSETLLKYLHVNNTCSYFIHSCNQAHLFRMRKHNSSIFSPFMIKKSNEMEHLLTYNVISEPSTINFFRMMYKYYLTNQNSTPTGSLIKTCGIITFLVRMGWKF